MSRMFLVWSLLCGLALAGADWYIERGHVSVSPSTSEGLVTAMEDGCPPINPRKN
jgi:hypothetical protein